MKAARIALTFVLGAAAAAGAQGPAAEWPQYLGPKRNGMAAAAIPAKATLAVAWKKPLAGGSSAIVAAGPQIFTLGSDGETDALYALEAATGSMAWKVDLGPTHADAASGPGSTPVVAGDLVIAVSTRCEMKAVNRQTRAIAWTVDFASAFSSALAKRGGCHVSPLLAGSRLVVVTGSGDGRRIAAIDAASGKVGWTLDAPPSNGGPLGWTDEEGGRVLYHHVQQPPGVSGVTAIDPESGKVAWQIEGTQGMSGTVPLSIGGGRVLLERWPHATLYDVAKKNPVWTTRDLAGQENPSVHHKGHIYGFGGQSSEFLTCVDAATGQVKWASRIYRGHLALAGDTIVVAGAASGVLRLVAADPAAYREIARVDILAPGARTITPPTVVGGRIYVRNLEEIVAVDVR